MAIREVITEAHEAAKESGAEARRAGLELVANPYLLPGPGYNHQLAVPWEEGWHEADRQIGIRQGEHHE